MGPIKICKKKEKKKKEKKKKQIDIYNYLSA